MDYKTKEDIYEKIKDYDFKRLMDTFNYVHNCKNNLIGLAKSNKELIISDYEELITYFTTIENCIYDSLFEEK